MDNCKNQNKTQKADPPVSGGTVLFSEEARGKRAAFLLCQTLALGILRHRLPHVIEGGEASLSERRYIMQLLLTWTDSHTVALAGGDQVIEDAIKRGRQG